MSKITIYRIEKIGITPILKKPLVRINDIGEGNYKKIINKVIPKDTIFTLKEYDKKIVEFSNKKGIVVEDENIFIPTFFEQKMETLFNKKGPLNVGIIFLQKDYKLGEKIILKLCKFSKFLTMLKYRNSSKLVEKVLDNEGLIINVENNEQRIRKGCDILLDLNKKIDEEEYE